MDLSWKAYKSLMVRLKIEFFELRIEFWFIARILKFDFVR